MVGPGPPDGAARVAQAGAVRAYRDHGLILPFFGAAPPVRDDSAARPNGVIRYRGAHVRGGIGRCVRMTTFEDSDLFTEVFHDFRNPRHRAPTPGARRPGPRWSSPQAWWLSGSCGHAVVPSSPTRPVDASTLLPQFAVGQKAGDRLSADDLSGLGVRPRTTRFLTETSTGAHYAAVGTSGHLCVVTVQSRRPCPRPPARLPGRTHGSPWTRRCSSSRRRRPSRPPRAAGARRAPTSS